MPSIKRSLIELTFYEVYYLFAMALIREVARVLQADE
jgi:hypothetical protein